MSVQLTLEQVIGQIFSSHKITRHDQHLLMSMFASRPLDSYEKILFNQVYEALHRGLLRVVD